MVFGIHYLLKKHHKPPVGGTGIKTHGKAMFKQPRSNTSTQSHSAAPEPSRLQPKKLPEKYGKPVKTIEPPNDSKILGTQKKNGLVSSETSTQTNRPAPRGVFLHFTKPLLDCPWGVPSTATESASATSPGRCRSKPPTPGEPRLSERQVGFYGVELEEKKTLQKAQRYGFVL